MRALSDRIYKVRPVTDKIPDKDGSWDLSTYQYADTMDVKALADKYGDRKVLLVRPEYSRRRTKSSLLEGDGKYNANPSDQSDYFFIDVPNYFFDTSEVGQLGDFSATPEYNSKDVLHIKWTGWGRHSGWIDLNVQQRGAGGGGTTTVEKGGCAKWS